MVRKGSTVRVRARAFPGDEPAPEILGRSVVTARQTTIRCLGRLQLGSRPSIGTHDLFGGSTGSGAGGVGAGGRSRLGRGGGRDDPRAPRQCEYACAGRDLRDGVASERLGERADQRHPARGRGLRLAAKEAQRRRQRDFVELVDLALGRLRACLAAAGAAGDPRDPRRCGAGSGDRSPPPDLCRSRAAADPRQDQGAAAQCGGRGRPADPGRAHLRSARLEGQG